MKLDWMMLANYAEVNNGLLYIAGGSWDTTTIKGPLPPEAPEGAVAMLQGFLVVRTLFHATETNKPHKFTITLMDEDGGEVANIGGEVQVGRSPGHPPGWDHGVNLAIPLTGMLLPRFGLYNFSFLIDDQHLGDRPFRVLKGY